MYKKDDREKIVELQTTIESLSKKVDSLADQLNDAYRLIRDSLYNTEENREYCSLEHIMHLLRTDKNKKRRVLIGGYYGARNAGDELMLQSILDKIDPEKNDVTILSALNYALDSSAYFPYHIIHYPKRISDCICLAENFDLIIWGGGAVIDDTKYYYDGLSNDLTYILGTVSKMMIALQKDVYVIGVSTNSVLTNQNLINDLCSICCHAKHFSVRDNYSKQTLLEAGINIDKVEVIDDLSLSLDFEVSPQKHDGLVVGVVYILDEGNIDYLAKHMDLLISAAVTINTSVTFKLIPFFDQYNHDIGLLEKLIEKINRTKKKKCKIEISEIEFNAKDVSKVFNSIDLLISMRYHATLIGGAIFGVKTLSVNYGDTHRHYINKIKYITDHYCNGMVDIPYKNITSSDGAEAFKKCINAKQRYLSENDVAAIRAEHSRILNLI